jgi:hypothetical protein
MTSDQICSNHGRLLPHVPGCKFANASLLSRNGNNGAQVEGQVEALKETLRQARRRTSLQQTPAKRQRTDQGTLVEPGTESEGPLRRQAPT